MTQAQRPAKTKEALTAERDQLLQAMQDGARYRDIYPMLKRVEDALFKLDDAPAVSPF